MVGVLAHRNPSLWWLSGPTPPTYERSVGVRVVVRESSGTWKPDSRPLRGPQLVSHRAATVSTVPMTIRTPPQIRRTNASAFNAFTNWCTDAISVR
jgi:hypothetical protein